MLPTKNDEKNIEDNSAKKSTDVNETTDNQEPQEPEKTAFAISDFLIKIVLLFASIGEYIAEAIVKVLCFFGRILKRFFVFLWDITNDVRKILLKSIKSIGRKIASPFIQIYRFFRSMKKEIIHKRKRKGLFSSINVAIKYIFNFFFGKKGVVITLINYAAPIISVFFLFSIVSYATSTEYAVKLNVNDVFYGYIENEQVFTDAQNIVSERINSIDSSVNIEANATFSIEKVGYNQTLTQYQVADMILQNSDINIEYAYGFYINDQFFGALRDIEPVKQALEKLLDSYRTSNPTETVAFIDDIRYDEAGLYISDSIVESDWLISVLTSMKSGASYYDVVEGDTPLLIGEKLNMTQAQIESLNPGFTTENLLVGDRILRSSIIPFLSVAVTKTETYEETVAFETEYYDDDTIFKDSNKIVIEGQPGINTVTASVSYVNGIAVSRNIISSTVVSEPVTEVVAIGTKVAPSGTTYSTETAVSGSYIWPVDGGYVSEWGYWDGGYAGHTGVDIAAPYGTSIFAGDSGTVILADWNYGYGKCVIIQHANGLQTLYGHCSSLFVSTGQYVSQGELIAAVGQTGVAYGNHCHFEVRNGTVRYNPRYYLASIR